MHARLMWMTGRSSLSRLVQYVGNDREKEEKMDYISAKIWESDVKNQGTINNREDKREHFSL